MTAALLVASLLYRPCILSAVAWAESRDSWAAVAGSHRGPYQIAVRHSRLPWSRCTSSQSHGWRRGGC